MAVKRIEDELLLPTIFDKPGTALALAMPDSPAEAFGVKAADLKRWGAMMGEQLTRPVTENGDRDLFKQLSIGPEIAAIVAHRKTELQADAEWMERITNCHIFLAEAWI